MGMDTDEMINTSVSLPEPLVKTLKEIAKREGRSLSSQVRLFLAESVTRKNTDALHNAEHPAHPHAA